MAKLAPALERTIAFEGGYSNSPIDRGGETYCGVSRNMHPDWPGWIAIDRQRQHAMFPNNLDHLVSLHILVANFYRDVFWHPMRLEMLHEQAVANEVFECAVNVGRQVAARFLQRSANALSRGHSIFAQPLLVDGFIGNRTIDATNALTASDGPDNLCKMLNVLQGAHYVEIVESRPTQEAFLRGWLSRVAL